jgi:predicted nucleic acid-binding protein
MHCRYSTSRRVASPPHSRATGRPISHFDCQIAAIARAREATVATRNTSDYEGCGIALMNPWTFSTRL